LSAKALSVFFVSAIAWIVYFYAIDWLIMEGQGLPVRWTLMPV